MVDGTQTDISPWSSGTWKFDPRQIGLISPAKAKKQRKDALNLASSSYEQERRPSGKFGTLPEEELLRIGSILLFAASGFALAIIAIILLA